MSDYLTICVLFAVFMCYALLVVAVTLVLIFKIVPQYGQTHIMVYIGVCSLVGSLSVCMQFSGPVVS